MANPLRGRNSISLVAGRVDKEIEAAAAAAEPSSSAFPVPQRSKAATMPAAAVASPLLLSLSSSSSPFLSSASNFLPPSSSIPASANTVGRRKPAASILRALRAEAATLPVLSFTGDKVGEAVLDLKSAPPSTARAVVHRTIITDRQNARRGTASTLTRGEVRGGGRKP
jgi:large subunit ribosomal protein L4